MPSPVGHAVAGAALALAFEPLLQDRPGPSLRVALVSSVLLAALPDADLLYQPIHRAVTHSLGSAAAITILATVVTRWVTKSDAVRFGLLCGIAWGSHSLLDWLGADPNPPRGIRVFWPISDAWYISDIDLFRGTERRQLLAWTSIVYNLKAIGQEVAILGPILVACGVWRLQRRRPASAS